MRWRGRATAIRRRKQQSAAEAHIQVRIPVLVRIFLVEYLVEETAAQPCSMSALRYHKCHLLSLSQVLPVVTVVVVVVSTNLTTNGQPHENSPQATSQHPQPKNLIDAHLTKKRRMSAGGPSNSWVDTFRHCCTLRRHTYYRAPNHCELEQP